MIERSLLEQYVEARLRGGAGRHITALLQAGAGLPRLDETLVMLYVGQRGRYYRRAQQIVCAKAYTIAERSKWHISANPYDVGRAALKHWVFDQCGTCDGRRYESIPGAPALSVQPCAACKGTGRAKLDDQQFPDYLRQLCTWFDVRLCYAHDLIRSRLIRLPDQPDADRGLRSTEKSL